MQTMIVLAGLAIASVLLLSGVAKLRFGGAVSGLGRVLREVGLPASAAQLTALCLPGIEIGIATLMLLPGGGQPAAWLAAILFTGFAAGIALLQLRGKQPACQCFGQLASAPLGWGAAGRSLLLALLALALARAWDGQDQANLASSLISLWPVLEKGDIILLVLGPAAVLQAWLIFQLLQQQGRLLLRIDHLTLRVDLSGIPAIDTPTRLLQAGDPVPQVAAQTLDGGPATLREALAGGALLVFSHPDCAPCLGLLEDLGNWRQGRSVPEKMVVLSSGTLAANGAKFGALALDAAILVQHGMEANLRFGVAATPSALRIDADGRIASELVVGQEAIMRLARDYPRARPPMRE